MNRTDAELIADALEHLRILHGHLDRANLTDRTVADAVALRLAAMIEVLSAATPELRGRVFGDSWGAAWATRNRIAHGYASVDLDIIRATVERDLPQIEAALRTKSDGD